MKDADSLEGKVYMTSAACMSVWADALSWANKHKEKTTLDPVEADNLVVLSCQVTDLAILNDFKTMEALQQENPGKEYFISGCLSKREDIPMPELVQRLDTPRENYQFLEDLTLVHFEKPFWIDDFAEGGDEFEQGHLFRNMYPLRIGKGCPNKCTYCTIRVTRGDFEAYDAARLEEEFLAFDDILLIADSPTEKQVKEWCAIAQKHGKPFSIRNVEPSITVRCKDELIETAEQGLIKVYHSPIQSDTPEVLRNMNRNVGDTLETIAIARQLKESGVYIATNIIIDYKDMGQDFSKVYDLYDYVSWNPLWDGKWDQARAEQRFEKYLGGK
ncbi:radical SAM protein [Candidatus Woesearchaeota archaeon]|nr:radical SAM protein [Candidatus Woesearchaeota archaeon]